MIAVNLVDVNGKSRKVNLGRELASGGAGTVYLVDGEPSKAVKIYHPQTLIDEGKIYAEKIICMLQSVPSLASSATGIVQISWPLAIARDLSGNFVGFSMHTLDFQNTEGLESLLQPKQARKKNLRSDLGSRITVAANLAGVVSAIHDKGHQVVDLKPPNLRFYRKELYVTVLDCDGFQIHIPGQALPAPQVTVEYLAPEFQSKPVAKPEHQDRFALGVIIFRLLNFGIHPYQGISKDPNAPPDMEGKISQGMYGYAKTPHLMIEPLPQSAHTFFPEELWRLFDRAFGSFVDKRPTAHEWAEALIKYAQPKYALLKQCGQGHLWFTGQQCGVCHRNATLNPGQVISSQTATLNPGQVISSQTATQTPTIATAKNPSSSPHTSLRFAMFFVGIVFFSHFFSYGVLVLISIGIGVYAKKKMSKTFSDALIISILILALSSTGKYGWHLVAGVMERGPIPTEQKDGQIQNPQIEQIQKPKIKQKQKAGDEMSHEKYKDKEDKMEQKADGSGSIVPSPQNDPNDINKSVPNDAETYQSQEPKKGRSIDDL